MTDKLVDSMVTIAVAIIGVAILAVIVSRQSNTSNVILSAGKAFAGSLQVAVSPITSSGFSGSNLLSGAGGF